MKLLSAIALIFLFGSIIIGCLSMRENEQEKKSTEKAIQKMFGGNN